MKKLVMLTIVAFLATATYAGATTTWTNTSGSTATQTGDYTADLGSTQFRTSTNVTLIGDGDTAGFNAVSGHKQGDVMYQGDSVSPTVTEQTKTKGTDVGTGDVPSGYTAGATSS